ncbi:hypothetical protein E4L96_16435 [Massilia arenosa]|uniref:Uncharacterized protein n=1 Tax=Zemynaea arenosa TaxID=2561931 RepID=A0A4Y9S4M9_9BURK|nr:hypothetical protein [Massilia arenosa]TFW16400.1 hypothetical protein E4L96_16435 [Massilia arenosa]
MNTQARLPLRRIGAGIVATLWAASVWAAPKPMSDAELSAVSGQGVFAVSNSSLNGFDFMRVALDADVALNANLTNLRLGEYAYAARNGTGADLDIGALQFGRTDAGVAKQVVQITNPYFEFVFRDTGNGTREAIGMRLGFDGIAGDVGTRLASISGSLQIATSGGTVDTANDALGGKRFDNTCATCVGPTLNQIGGITAGDASGPSRDFWISILKTPVTFPSAPGMPALTEAQAGIWMNWRDKLVALNINGTLPPNNALAR